MWHVSGTGVTWCCDPLISGEMLHWTLGWLVRMTEGDRYFEGSTKFLGRSWWVIGRSSNSWESTARSMWNLLSSYHLASLGPILLNNYLHSTTHIPGFKEAHDILQILEAQKKTWNTDFQDLNFMPNTFLWIFSWPMASILEISQLPGFRPGSRLQPQLRFLQPQGGERMNESWGENMKFMWQIAIQPGNMMGFWWIQIPIA